MLTKRLCSFAIVSLVLAAAAARADVEYVQEGHLGGALKAMPFGLGKVKTRVWLKGDAKREEVGERSVTITRLDRETVYTVDLKGKSYSKVTFAEMREEMKRALEELYKSPQEVEGKRLGKDYDLAEVSVKDTGRNATIAGFPSKEMLLSVTAQGTDPETGKPATFVMDNSVWLTNAFEGWNEVTAFDRKLGEKLGMAQALAKSGTVDGVQKSDAFRKARIRMTEASSRLEGFPVRVETRFGLPIPPQQAQAERETPAKAAATPEPERDQTPRGGGGVGGVGGLLGKIGKKVGKKDRKESPENGAEPTEGSASAFSFIVEVQDASVTPAGPDRFEVPGGFREVPHVSPWDKRK